MISFVLIAQLESPGEKREKTSIDHMLRQKPSPITDPAPLTLSVKGNKAAANVSGHLPPHPSICSAADEEASRKLPIFR